MREESNYIEKNKKLWNTRTDYHIKSKFYDLDGFIGGASSLNEIELSLLGNVAGKTILHLQCHFGQDTLSLARQGAWATGVDFSEKAIEKARELAMQLDLRAQFICSNLYELQQPVGEKYDIVFTSYGTIGWLPDLDKWGRIVANLLKPGGQFILVEFHPVVWMFDNDFNTIAYSYFKKEAIIESEPDTYADKDASIHLESVTWNHSLSEVFQSLITSGLDIKDFKEYDYSPYNCFKGCEQIEEKKFVIKKLGTRIPMVYSIIAAMK